MGRKADVMGDGLLAFAILAGMRWAAVATIRAAVRSYRRWSASNPPIQPRPQVRPKDRPPSRLKYMFRPEKSPEVKSLERAIVKCAMVSDGMVSPADVVAAYTDWGMDEVRDRIKVMVDKGHVEMRATKSGAPPVVYVIPEFLTDEKRLTLGIEQE